MSDSLKTDESVNIIRKAIILDTSGTALIVFVLFMALDWKFVIIPIVGIVFKVVARIKFSIRYEYSNDSEILNAHVRRIKAWLVLSECKMIWQVIHKSNVSNRKKNAGAGLNINRVICSIEKSKPFYINGIFDAIQIKLNKEKVILLPEYVLIIKNINIKILSYDDINIHSSHGSFIESESVPKDAIVIRSTWQYVNKNGSPDKRYKDNRQIPVCQYGNVRVSSELGLNIEMYASNVNKSNEFDKLIRISKKNDTGDSKNSTGLYNNWLFDFVGQKTSNANFIDDCLLEEIKNLGFMGQFVKSNSGDWVLLWDDYDEVSRRGGARENGNGHYALCNTKSNTVLVDGRSLERPNNGCISENGNFSLEDWHFSSGSNGTFYIFSPDGAVLLSRKYSANITKSKISPSGKYAVCQTAGSPSDDGNKLTLFDIESKNYIFINPEIWAHDYKFNEDKRELVVVSHLGEFRYSFTGEFLDSKALSEAQLNFKKVINVKTRK